MKQDNKKATTKKPYKIEWDLSLLYKSDNDPQIEKDLQKIEKMCADFEKKYRKVEYISSPKKLLKALEDYEVLLEKVNDNKPWWYFTMKTILNSDDTVSTATATRFEQRITKAANKTIFFVLAIGSIPKVKQKVFLKDRGLQPYVYMLERIFEKNKYLLSEKEERIASLLSQTSYTMWIDGQDRVLNQQTVIHKGKEVPLDKAASLVSELPKQERRQLHTDIYKKLETISPFAEAEINAICNYKKVMDELRGYKHPYSATIQAYENDEKSIEKFVDLVTKYFSVSQRFYALHAKLLGEKKITVADINVPLGTIDRKFDFDSSVACVRNAFATVGEKYIDILDQYVRNGQIDVYPRKGKGGGAFCANVGTLPVVVLLNHADNMRSLETLAHEMGHAIHSELSRSQPARYREYTIATAEVASTFFEQVVQAEIEKQLSEEERLILLHTQIKGDVATIFRQISFFNFERELHQRIRTEGQMSRDDIAKLMVKHFQSVFGAVVEVTTADGYFFVKLSHIRSFFYVYSYAYGQLISRTLYENWKADPTYIEKIEQFLSAGRSMSPEDIFKSIGIDTSKPEFFEAGLKSIDADITRLEKMAKKQGRI